MKVAGSTIIGSSIIHYSIYSSIDMENVQNKDVKSAEAQNHSDHECGSCHGGGHAGCGHHSMLCSGKWGGWHGRHSIIRVTIGVLLVVGAFCAGSEFGELKGEFRGERGYGYGMHQRVSNYGNYGSYYGNDEGSGYYGRMGPGMMFYGQQLPVRTVVVSATATTPAR
jgi:hypothetical protein